MFDDCIIMAGGSGTRLWPASNSRRPKQFLDFAPGKSFFSAALERGLAVIDKGGDGRVIVIAGKAHAPQVIAAAEKFPPADRERFLLLCEPAAKNTAPALACGARYAALSAGEDRTVLVLTSDHLISPLERFRLDAAAAADFARGEELVVFGIPPSGPETGYGYVEAGERLSLPGGPEVFRAASFREKPDRKTAEGFLASGRFFWNSGMFAFSTGFIAGEFRRSAPGVSVPFEALEAPPEPALGGSCRVLEDWPGLAEAYRAAEAISFDYAVAEKCPRRALVRAGFDWTDVGSWDEYGRIRGDGGTEVFCAGAGNCFVDADLPVALCGVEDLVVVIRSGAEGVRAALVAKKGETQRVREIVEQINGLGRADLW
jgi:mannose-1-phosphate guanylyltransferase/mannose-1-phosphate guanylyltransferase/mannose-6-phosphate isomerase